jgi:hypothetical protein
MTGVGYPAFSGLVRSLKDNQLKSRARLDRLDLHGMLMLLFAIVILTPQFFVLATLVLGVCGGTGKGIRN